MSHVPHVNKSMGHVPHVNKSMSHVPHMNESCPTCEQVKSYTWTSHVTFEWVMSHRWMSHVINVNESCLTCEWVMSHIWMSHVSHMNKSSRTHEQVMSHVNESCPTDEWVMSHPWTSHVTFFQRCCMRNVSDKTTQKTPIPPREHVVFRGNCVAHSHHPHGTEQGKRNGPGVTTRTQYLGSNAVFWSVWGARTGARVWAGATTCKGWGCVCVWVSVCTELGGDRMQGGVLKHLMIPFNVCDTHTGHSFYMLCAHLSIFCKESSF